MIKGQAAGRLSLQRRVIREPAAQLILKRTAAQAYAAGAQDPIQWDTVLWDKWRLFNPATPSLIRVPTGATWAKAGGFYEWDPAGGLSTAWELFFAFGINGVGGISYAREISKESESGRSYSFAWMPVDASQSVYLTAYHNSTSAALIRAHGSIRFARGPRPPS